MKIIQVYKMNPIKVHDIATATFLVPYSILSVSELFFGYVIYPMFLTHALSFHMIYDLIWITIQPKVIPSLRKLIILHHIVVLLFLIRPFPLFFCFLSSSARSRVLFMPASSHKWKKALQVGQTWNVIYGSSPLKILQGLGGHDQKLAVKATKKNANIKKKTYSSWVFPKWLKSNEQREKKKKESVKVSFNYGQVNYLDQL